MSNVKSSEQDNFIIEIGRWYIDQSALTSQAIKIASAIEHFSIGLLIKKRLFV